MIPKAIDAITEGDLQDLVVGHAAEGRRLEFKADFPGRAESESVPLLSSLSAFANTDGGDLLVGVVAENGVAVAIESLSRERVDAELLRVESLLRNGIEPRISSIKIRPVPTSDGNVVVVFRVHPSAGAPHRVKANSKFYARNAAGKYPMDIGEIRRAFEFAADAVTWAKRFRSDRVARFLYREGCPVDMISGPTILVHVVPVLRREHPDEIALESLVENRDLQPVIGSSWRTDINLDGVIAYASIDGEAVSATQYFRFGAYETASVLTFNDERIPAKWAESIIARSIKQGSRILHEFSVAPPYCIFVSLIGAKGMMLGVNGRLVDPAVGRPIREQIIEFPESLLYDPDTDFHRSLKTQFDRFWNTFGFPRSYNFDDNGIWSG